MPESLSFCTWVRTSSRKGLAMDPASIFLAPGACLVSDAMVDGDYDAMLSMM